MGFLGKVIGDIKKVLINFFNLRATSVIKLLAIIIHGNKRLALKDTVLGKLIYLLIHRLGSLDLFIVLNFQQQLIGLNVGSDVI
jgi:hypothetical protein